MRDLLQLFVRSGGFITFLLLEVFCFYLIANFNQKQRKIWLHSANTATGAIEKKRNSVSQYFGLEAEADRLAAENARLLAELSKSNSIRIPYRDTVREVKIDTVRGDFVRPLFSFRPAMVINNTVTSANNYLTIDQGAAQGIRPGLGVISPDGVVGIVRDVSKNYSLVLSILNRNSKISAALKKTGHFGSLVWEGNDPKEAILHDIPKHVQFAPGDTVVTSGFSEIFPPGRVVGRVKFSSVEPGSNFYDIAVELTNDLSQARHVYVVDNLFRAEIDSLQAKIPVSQ